MKSLISNLVILIASLSASANAEVMNPRESVPLPRNIRRPFILDQQEKKPDPANTDTFRQFDRDRMIPGIEDLIDRLRSTRPEGHSEGNGGDALVCENGKVQVLDVYEMETLLVQQFSTGSFGADWGKFGDPAEFEQMMQEFIARFARISPEVGPLLKHEYMLMKGDGGRNKGHAYLPGSNFTNIPDSNHTHLPKECKLKQIAIHRDMGLSIIPKFIFNQELTSKLPMIELAALWMHELLYKVAIKYGANDSAAVRILNGLILSDTLKDLSGAEYFRLMRASRWLGEVKTITANGTRYFMHDKHVTRDNVMQIQVHDLLLMLDENGEVLGGKTIP